MSSSVRNISPRRAETWSACIPAPQSTFTSAPCKMASSHSSKSSFAMAWTIRMVFSSTCWKVAAFGSSACDMACLMASSADSSAGASPPTAACAACSAAAAWSATVAFSPSSSLTPWGLLESDASGAGSSGSSAGGLDSAPPKAAAGAGAAAAGTGASSPLGPTRGGRSSGTSCPSSPTNGGRSSGRSPWPAIVGAEAHRRAPV
mmetsp:Transcript_141374/g.439384  ORF Transcript_141374/g.439384 Transcript_141374/m.439384 type:complete len:204 (+) Transcript_141374:1124-1735(+)